jgi:hypothetical protein
MCIWMNVYTDGQMDHVNFYAKMQCDIKGIYVYRVHIHIDPVLILLV